MNYSHHHTVHHCTVYINNGMIAKSINYIDGSYVYFTVSMLRNALTFTLVV